ncbi:MAG: hypothetical protein CMK59_15190 [Proteobacteria bacterium]|nr:hypothetical protein [Pseudomonadota bacterium]
MLFILLSCFDETDLQDVEQVCGSDFIEQYNVEELLEEIENLSSELNVPDTATVDTAYVVLEPECQEYKAAFEDLKAQEQDLLLEKQKNEMQEQIENDSDCALVEFGIRPNLSSMTWVIDLKVSEGGSNCSLSCSELFTLSQGLGLHCQTYTKESEDVDEWEYDDSRTEINVSGAQIGRILFSSIY